MNFKQQVLSILPGLATVAVLALIAYLLFAAGINKLNSIDSDLGKTIAGASIAVIGATITLVVGKHWEQKIKIRQDVQQKKV